MHTFYFLRSFFFMVQTSNTRHRELLTDPSWYLLLIVVLITLVIGAVRSLSFFVGSSRVQTTSTNKDSNELKWTTAILMPVLGSVVLLILFWWLEQLKYLLIAVFCFSSFVSLLFIFSPLLDKIARWTNLPPEYRYPSSGHSTAQSD